MTPKKTRHTLDETMRMTLTIIRMAHYQKKEAKRLLAKALLHGHVGYVNTLRDHLSYLHKVTQLQ